MSCTTCSLAGLFATFKFAISLYNIREVCILFAFFLHGKKCISSLFLSSHSKVSTFIEFRGGTPAMEAAPCDVDLEPSLDLLATMDFSRRGAVF